MSRGSSVYRVVEEDADEGVYTVDEGKPDQNTLPKQYFDGIGDTWQTEEGRGDSPGPISATQGHVTVVQVGNNNTTVMNPYTPSPDSGIGSPPGLADIRHIGIPCNIPFNKCRFFSGRASDMAYIYDSSVAKRTEMCYTRGTVFGLHGVGGVGKSTLAAEYAYENMDSHYSNGVFWVDASKRDTLPVQFANIGVLLKLEGMSQNNIQDNITNVKNWMLRNTDWLCIFDNADDKEVLKALTEENGYIPPEHSLRGDVIVTSRRASLQLLDTEHTREIIELSPEARKEFLLQRTKALEAPPTEKDMIALEGLVLTSSGIPLKLEQVGAYIVEKQVSYNEYLEGVLYKKHWEYGDVCTGDKKKNIANTYEPNFVAVESDNPDAIKILQYAALFNISEIPFEIFRSAWGRMGLSGFNRSFDIKEMLSIARNFSLFRYSPTGLGFNMHQVVQEQLFERMPLKTRKAIVHSLLNILYDIFQIRQSDERLRRDMLIHAEEFLAKAWTEQLLPNTPANLMKIGILLLKIAQTHATLGCFEVARKIVRRVDDTVMPLVETESFEGLYLQAEMECQSGLLFLWKGLPDRQQARVAQRHFENACSLATKADEKLRRRQPNVCNSDVLDMTIKRAEMLKWLVCAAVEWWETRRVLGFIEEATNILDGINREECNAGQMNQIKRHQAQLACQTGKFYKLKALEAPLRFESRSPCQIEYMEKALCHYKRAVEECPPNDNRKPLYSGQLDEMKLRVVQAKGTINLDMIDAALTSLRKSLGEVQSAVGNCDRYAGFIRRKIAWVLHLREDNRAALLEIDESIEVLKGAFLCGTKHCKFGTTFHLKGQILRAMGRFEEAYEFLKKAESIYKDTGNEAGNPKYRLIQHELKSCQEEGGFDTLNYADTDCS